MRKLRDGIKNPHNYKLKHFNDRRTWHHVTSRTYGTPPVKLTKYVKWNRPSYYKIDTQNFKIGLLSIDNMDHYMHISGILELG